VAEPQPTRYPVPPCAVCGETNQLEHVVGLRDGFTIDTAPGYWAQVACEVCHGRGPRGYGVSPEAAMIDALTVQVENAERHRAWVAAGRPAHPWEVADV
jgi:hypothetical protein